MAAAGPLFVRDGYLATTMAGLATAAGVAVQTLYLSFGSKAAILEAALAAAAPDDPDGWHGRRAGGRSGPAVLRAHVGATAAALERRYPLLAVLRAAAADPEPAQLLAAARRAGLTRHAQVVDELAERPGFSELLSLQRATEIVHALLSPDLYGQLVVEEGWAVTDWVAWVTRHLLADLFPAQAAAG